MAEMNKLDHLEERLRATEGVEDYAFANLEELFLVPDHGYSQVQGAGLWQVQGDYLPQEPSKDVLSEDGGIRKRWVTTDTFLPKKVLLG